MWLDNFAESIGVGDLWHGFTGRDVDLKNNKASIESAEKVNSDNLAWQREQYYNDIAVSDRRRQEDWDRQDTELERALEQAKKNGVSPLAVLGVGLGSGVVGGNSPSGGYSGSSAMPTLSNSAMSPVEAISDLVGLSQSERRVKNEIQKVDDARDLNNRMLEVDKSQFDANQKYLYDKLQSEIQIASEHNDSQEAIAQLTRESVEYCTRYQVAVEKGISMAKLEEQKAEYYKDLELKKKEIEKKWGLEAERLQLEKADSKSKRLSAIASMIGSCGIALKGVSDATGSLASTFLKKKIGF